MPSNEETDCSLLIPAVAVRYCDGGIQYIPDP